jgi:hypothetical protein
MTETAKETSLEVSNEIPGAITSEQAIAMIRNPMMMPGSYMKRLAFSAETFFASGLVPKGISNKSAALVVMMKGIELGFGPMESFSHIHVINGRPTLSAESMKNLVYRNCPEAVIDIEHCDETKCTVTGKKPKHKPMTVTFSIEDAKLAGLMSNPTWQKYPRAMLRSRAITELVRSYFSEFTAGFSYCPEEMGATVNEEGEPINVTPPRPQGPAPKVTPRGQDATIEAELSLPAEPAAPAEPGTFGAYEGKTVTDGATLEAPTPPVKPLYGSDFTAPPLPVKVPAEPGPDDINLEALPPQAPASGDQVELSPDMTAALWLEIKGLYKGDAIKGKQFVEKHIGKKPSKAWNMGDYKKCIKAITDEFDAAKGKK